jgi:hypothetical protein
MSKPDWPRICDYKLEFGDVLESVIDGVIHRGRYGYWDRDKRKVETSDDLDYLQKKYGPGLPVSPE